MVNQVRLRGVRNADLAVFFEQQLDPLANHMAAFTTEYPEDRNAFDAHWAKILGDPKITIRTIVSDQQIAGHVECFERFGQLEVSYWLGARYWGMGIASQALAAFLEEVRERPLYARAAKDNVASIRVLRKCGFAISGEDKGFANARGGEVEEYILELVASE